jgi:LCP family protein required for cell wall assembly
MKSETIKFPHRIFLFGFIILLLVIFLSVTVARIWNKPLAPSLELPTQTPSTTPSPDSTATPTLTPEVTNFHGITSTAQATAIPLIATENPPSPQPTKAESEPLCGGPPVMTILALGIDTRADDYLYGLADVIRIIRVDFVTPKVTALSLPRDLWVEIPGISDHYGITHGKLNQAYFYGTEGMGYYDGPGGAPGLMARALTLNFGLHVDHYITVNMNTFVRMVDAVGGIDIYLPHDVDGRPVDDKTEDMGFFPAGAHHFTGDMALRFSRIRKVDTVFDRMDRQTMVICALREKLLTPAVLPRIPQLITSFQGSVITDLSPAQLSQLVCLAPQVKSVNLLFGGLPQEILNPGREDDPRLNNTTFVWKADYQVIRDYVTQFQAGTWPNTPDEPTCP